MFGANDELQEEYNLSSAVRNQPYGESSTTLLLLLIAKT